jgi:hypothetical protein
MPTVLLPFPEDCPPSDARAVAGVFYVYAERHLLVDEPTGRMTWQRPYEKRRGDHYGRTDLVEAHGLSVFQELADMHEARRLTPWLRKKSVAAVTISSTSGWLRNSPTPEGASHHDWWTNPYDLIPEGRVIEEKLE